ncbi:MAG: hypothetical protein JSU65_02235, partial [Candidatus Zixiibacteriota bacterium]
MFAEILRSKDGLATVIALLMVCMLTLIGLAALSTSNDEVTIAGNELQEMRAFHAAEAGIEMAAATLQLQFETTGTYPEIMPTGVHTMNDCQIHYVTRDNGPATHEVISSGSLTGLHAVIKTFSINSVATSSIDNGRILMTLDFHNALVPIFQFAVFYDEDLEIAPGPPMTLAGRVHSNNDMWLQSGGGLWIDSWVTAGGSIFHGGKIGAATNADVQIRDAHSTYQSMLRDGYWLDHTHTDWYNLS